MNACILEVFPDCRKDYDKESHIADLADNRRTTKLRSRFIIRWLTSVINLTFYIINVHVGLRNRYDGDLHNLVTVFIVYFSFFLRRI